MARYMANKIGRLAYVVVLTDGDQGFPEGAI